MPRHLPPTAIPTTLSDLRNALGTPGGTQERLRAALAGYLGLGACRLASSGRTALFLLLRALRDEADHPGRREVAMPAYTCPALARVALDLDLRPRFVDISPQTLGFEAGALEGTVDERTLAVICVHPFGMPQPVEPARALAHAAGATLIEDAAQSLGARLGNQPVGTLGDFGLFSLGPGKPISTGGGGVLCARAGRPARLVDAAWQDLPAPSAAASGWSLARLALLTLFFHPRGWWLVTRLGLHRISDHEASWGYTLRGLSHAQAAVGLALLERLDAINARRLANARHLLAGLQGLRGVYVPSPTATALPIYLRLPLMVDDESRREGVYQRLWAAGIGVGRMYRNSLPQLFPEWADQPYPGAEYAARHLLTLPTHHYLAQADLAAILRILQAEAGD